MNYLTNLALFQGDLKVFMEPWRSQGPEGAEPAGLLITQMVYQLSGFDGNQEQLDCPLSGQICSIYKDKEPCTWDIGHY